jgi:fructose-bisphosphate aldolase class II
MVPLLQAAENKSLTTDFGTAVGAYNVNFYAQAEGILRGGIQTDAPLIVQSSRGANTFQGSPAYIRDMLLLAAQNIGKDLIISLHLDHGTEEAARDCCDNGFSSVMIDASKNDFDKNVAITAAIVEYAHKTGRSVEGEYGQLKGVEEDVVAEKSVYAKPEKVAEFFKKTKADALAAAYGTSHGPNKGKTTELSLHVVGESYRQMTAAGLNLYHFLVSHGSSRVPQQFVDVINRYGGTLKGTSGVPGHMVSRAIQLGMRKVNIDTDLRLAMTGQVRKLLYETRPELAEKSELVGMIKAVFDGKIKAKDKEGKDVEPGQITDPRSWLRPIMEKSPEALRNHYEDTKDDAFIAVNKVIADTVAKHVGALNVEFGSAGLAEKVDRSLTLEKMAKSYN